MFLAEVKRNLVAIISLCVALSGLAYNTWRNETTESHRNVRQASFVMLEQLGQLQQLVYQRYYAHQHDDINRITCWGKVLLVRDMGPLVSNDVAAKSKALFDIWSTNLDDLDEGNDDAEKAISGSIASVREQLLGELRKLK